MRVLSPWLPWCALDPTARRLMNSVMVGQMFCVVNCDVQNIVAHSELPLSKGQMLNIQALYEVSASGSPPSPPSAFFCR